MKYSSQESAKWSEHLQREEPSSSSVEPEIPIENAANQQTKCLNAPVSACEVVELEGEEAQNKWKDALDQRDFADSVMQALEGFVMNDLQELPPPEARTVETDEKKLQS